VSYRLHRPGSNRAVSFVEISIAITAIVLTVIPLVEFSRSVLVAPVAPEDFCYAECLALRVIERYRAESFDVLKRMQGQQITSIVEDIFKRHRGEDWYLTFPEFKQNFGINTKKFSGSLRVTELDEGLLALDVVIRWKILRNEHTAELDRHYALTRLICDPELGLRSKRQEKSQ